MVCASATTLTGRTGRVDVGGTLIARLTNWNANPNLATKSEWGDSDTQGYTAVRAGRKACSMTTEGKFDTVSEVWDLFDVGDTVDLTCWMDASALYWNFPCAVCNDFSLAVDVDSEEVIGWTAGWDADGIFYRPGAANAPSKTYPT